MSMKKRDMEKIDEQEAIVDHSDSNISLYFNSKIKQWNQ